MASLKSSSWTGNFTEEELKVAELQQKMAQEYQRAIAQQNSLIGTTALPPWASVSGGYAPPGPVTSNTTLTPVVKDDGYYKKVAEELTKLVHSAERTSRDNYSRAVKAETELASYKGLIPWLMINHPELLEEFNVFLKAKARLEVEE